MRYKQVQKSLSQEEKGKIGINIGCRLFDKLYPALRTYIRKEKIEVRECDEVVEIAIDHLEMLWKSFGNQAVKTYE